RKKPDIPAETPETPENQPEVSYSFSATLSAQSGAVQEFRTATVKGYRCPICASYKSPKLQKLQFHLTTRHSKYSFQVQKQRRDPVSDDLTQVQIKVDTPFSSVPIKKEPE